MVPAELQPFYLEAELDLRHEAGDVDGLTPDEVAELDELFAQLPELERRGDEPGRHPLPSALIAADVERVDEADELLVLSATQAPAWPIGRTCSTAYRAKRTSGTRRLSAIELGVVHCTQGATARGAASWFANPASKGSAHVAVDGRECYRTLPPSAIPWGAPGVNGNGWHLELAAYAQWSRAEWLSHPVLLQRGAYKLAANGRGHFPMRFLTDRELADVLRRKPGRRHGIVSHRQVSRVFGGDHTDPGAHFPWDVFMAHARRFERELARR